MSIQIVRHARQDAPPRIFIEIDHALRGDDSARAMQLARQALDEGHVHPALFSLRARWHRQHGRLDAALADLQRAYDLEPGAANTLCDVAECLNAMAAYPRAVLAADSALALAPSLAAAWYHKGYAHHMLTELDAARGAYGEAVRRDPRLVDAQARLASMAAAQGDFARARHHAGLALALEPGNAIATLACVAVDIADAKLGDAERRLAPLLRDPAIDPAIRTVALTHKADILDAQGETGQAFAAYDRANAIWKDCYASQVRPAGRETAQAQIVRVAAAIEALPAGAWRTAEPLSRALSDISSGLVFVLGFPRSGTTLLGQILGSVKDVVVLEEKPLLAQAAADFLQARDGIARLAALSGRDIARYREDFWRRAGQTGIDLRGKRVVDQTAFNTAYLPLIARLFPDARIVFAARDPRDVVFSCFRRQFAPGLFTMEFQSLNGTARFYADTMRLADLCRRKLGVETVCTRNEDVVADFDAQTGCLCAALGLTWSEDLRDFAQAARRRSLATRSAPQVQAGLSAKSIAQWRRYRDQMAPVLPILAPFVQKFGYAAE